jgi:hypothetical protein
MSTLETRRIDEIKNWRKAYVVSAMNDESRIMAEMVDDLLAFLDRPEETVSRRVVLKIGYNQYLLSPRIRMVDVVALVRACQSLQELDWEGKIKVDKQIDFEIRFVSEDELQIELPPPALSPGDEGYTAPEEPGTASEE